MQISQTEWQFLLWLQRSPDYRAPAAAVISTPKLSATRRDRLWRQLQGQGWVDFETQVMRFGLSATGRTLLHLDRSILPVTPDEKYVLQSCRDRSIHPDQISYKVSSPQRSALVASLAAQGLIRITRYALGDVWLTPKGRSLLLDENAPKAVSSPVNGTPLLSPMPSGSIKHSKTLLPVNDALSIAYGDRC